ncbi:hypothetical protein [Streptomyces chiangmaiensis]|uniref:Uncharacterized protein n=1 Tax=Streptomyces chiangmaiensis TaxID=766497 RepID=A0ABU7FSB1_9ACTN|nr:hypothetical protein [Streptomyces chiangmaiensis]MED7827001.1 hypothetical protein [Streptomyces chiangmaiensis]
MSGPHRDDRLPQLWEEHMRALFPAGFRGVDIEDVDLILLDANVAGLVQRELSGGLDGEGVAILWACITGLDEILPLIGDEYCTSYYARLRMMAGLTAARYMPSAI